MVYVHPSRHSEASASSTIFRRADFGKGRGFLTNFETRTCGIETALGKTGLRFILFLAATFGHPFSWYPATDVVCFAERLTMCEIKVAAHVVYEPYK